MPNFTGMTDEEIRAWIAQARKQLQRRMANDKNYLARRSRRGTSTPTDTLLSEDLALFEELDQFLEIAENA